MSKTTKEVKQKEHAESAQKKEVKHASTHAHGHIVPSKSITIKHHHAKPFRKRHVAGFTIFLVVGAVLIGLVAGYNSQVRQGLENAKNYIADTFNPKKTVNETVQSTYGFSVTYDTQKFYATAIDTHTGDLFIGNELSVNRAYELIRIAPSLSDASDENSNMTIRYYQATTLANPSDLAAIEATALKDITSKANLQTKKTGTSNVVYGGKPFLKTEWEFQSDNKVLAGFTPAFTTLTAVHEGKAFVIEVINNVVNAQKFNQYEEVLQSLYFGTQQKAAVAPTLPDKEERAAVSRNLLESALFGKVASAATTTGMTSEQISAIYGPAVVKLYNVFCQDIYLDGALFIRDACSGGTGSGFFINQDGHIASNGHVVSADPLDIIIQASYNAYRRGNSKPLDALVVAAKIRTTDLPAGGTSTERADALFDLLYQIESSRITTDNSVTNLLVTLGKEQPDVKELIKLTENREEYAEQDAIKRARVIAQDYRTIDGFAKYHASDVAIIKIDGSGYPVTKLGNITTLLQGANLNILGYPGNASNNGIVDTGTTTATLTSGKVSAIKNALGSEKKLIETDTTIGHGNSGGPAFNDAGEVVGVSTYTATKIGDGTYNYVRDVKDLIDLASTSSVTIDSKSLTQTEWEKAVDLFNNARYSKSIKSFNKVKELYPAHPKVDEFIAAAEENIKNGKDVKDFPVVLVLVGGLVLLAGAGVLVFFMIRHKKAHNVYKAHVGAGMMQPIPQGAAPQTVQYDPAHVAAQKNVVQMHQYMQPQPAMPQQPTMPQQAPVQVQMPQPAVVQPQQPPTQPPVAPQA